YRADIDGLRAVAVVSVILYHLNIPLFSGGFVGVDVFFVISGFLITHNLIKDFYLKQFSYIDFYYRRSVRLFLALFFLLAVILVTGFFFLIPQDYRSFGHSLKYVASFISNFLFMRSQNDYFEQSSMGNQVLLHTWSLSIEEQFYFFLPIVFALTF